MGILLRRYQTGGPLNPNPQPSKVPSDYEVGRSIIALYQQDAKKANEWYNTTEEGKNTSLITNIESVINTGMTDDEVAHLGSMYKAKQPLLASFAKFMTAK